MADNEQIGGVSIGITGDYSTLAADFAQAQQLAQRAGQGIASALDVAMARADGLTTAVAATSGAVCGAATALDHFSQESGLAGGELNIFRTVLQSSMDTGMGLVEAFREMAGSADSLGPAVANVSKAFADQMAAAQAAAGADDEVSASMQRVRSDAEKFEQAWESAIAEDRKRAAEAQKNAATFEKAWSDAIKENQARNEAAFKAFANSVEQGIAHPLQFAGAQVKEFMLALGPLGVMALGVAAGVAAVGYEALNLVKDVGAATEATGNLADRLNLTWNQTRELEEMAQIAGVSVNGLQMASFRLAEALENASGSGKKVADALTAIGVSGHSSGELLEGFLQKLADIPEDTKRIALAHEVMGRSSQQILPLIKNFGDLQAVVRTLGTTLDEEGVKKLQHVDDEFDKLSISWNRLKEQLAVKLSPTIEFVVKGATEQLKTQDVAADIVSASGTIGMLYIKRALGMQVEQVKAAGETLKAAAGESAESLQAAAHTWQDAHAKTLAGMKEALTATNAEIKSLESSLASTVNPLTSADRVAKQAAYNAALSKQGELQQAIADASVKDDDIKQKAIRSQTIGAQILTILLDDEANKHHQIAQEIGGVILAWQRLTGQVLTPWQVLQRDSEAAARSIANLKEHALDSAPALETIADAAMDVGKSLDKIISSSTEVAGSSGFKQLTEDGQRFGETTTYEFEKIAVDSQAAFERMQDSGLFTYDALARAAIKTRIAILDSQRATGQLSADEYRQAIDDQKALLDDLAGKSKDVNEKMGQGMRTFLHQTESAIKSVSSAITDLIVDGGKFSDAFAKVGKNIVKILVTDIVEYGFGKLLMAIFSADSALYNLGKGLAGVFGSATAKAAPGAVAATTAPLAANTAAVVADTASTTANTAGDVANTTATATDTIATVADAAATAVNAGATIADAIATAANTGAIAASTVESVASRVIWSTSETANTVATTANSGVVAANTAALAALTTALAASTGASAASGAAGAAGGAFGGAGGLLSGIGSIAQVGTFISSVVGNLQNAKQETTLNAIEHNTRFAMMYLGERADGGILGELFKINNEIAWGFNTKATEAILSLLESAHLTSGGGGSSGALVSITNSTFNGGASQADADRIGQAIVTQLQRAGAIRQ